MGDGGTERGAQALALRSVSNYNDAVRVGVHATMIYTDRNNKEIGRR